MGTNQNIFNDKCILSLSLGVYGGYGPGGVGQYPGLKPPKRGIFKLVMDGFK